MVASAAVSRLQPWKFAIFVARYVRFCTAVNRYWMAMTAAFSSVKMPLLTIL